MALRRTSSSSSSLLSAFGNIEKQMSAARTAQEDADYKNGLIDDADYINLLKGRRESSTSQVERVNIQNKIDTVTESVQRSKLVGRIEAGDKKADGVPYTYADLVTYENRILDDIIPGSARYYDQKAKVDSATDNLLSVARDQVKQLVQNEQATPRALAQFESAAIDAYDPGSESYAAQLRRVQDSTRAADKYDYQKQVSQQDAQFNVRLQAAKDAKNIAAVTQLTNEQMGALNKRVQEHPEFFTNPDGSPDANYINTVSRINSLRGEAENFAESVVRQAASDGEKALASEVSGQRKIYQSVTAEIEKKINNLGAGLDADGNRKFVSAEDKARQLADLYQQSVNAKQAYQDFNQQMFDQTGDVKYTTQVDQLSSDITGVQQKLTQVGDLISNIAGTVEVYDPKTNTFNLQANNNFDENGNPNIENLARTDRSIGRIEGQQRQLAKAGVTLKDGSNEVQLVNVNGVVHMREVNPNDPADVSSQTFKPVNFTDLAKVIGDNPDIAQTLGLSPEQQQQFVQAMGLQKIETGTAVQQDAPVAKALDDQRQVAVQPAAATTLPQALQDSGSDINAPSATVDYGSAPSLDTSTIDIPDLPGVDITPLDTSGIVRQQAEINAKQAALVKATQETSQKLQQTIKGTDLQNTASGKVLQNTATAQQVQPANVNPQQTVKGDAAKLLQGSGYTQPTVVIAKPAPQPTVVIRK